MNRPFELRASDRSADAVLTILRHFSNIIQSKIEEVIDDADIAALHDLRVATRRIRTVMSQTKGVLPPTAVEKFSPQFKWLASVTGRRRDLDVFLVEITRSGHRSESTALVLAGLRQFLEDTRREEHEVVRAALSSTPFEDLIGAWNCFVDAGATWKPEPPHASTAIIDVASPSILKAHLRVRKRSARMSPNAAPEILHRIRIDCKKLRYLLEVFCDLYPRKRISRFTRELKLLQDLLGEFNDTAAQLTLIEEFTGRSTASSNENTTTNHLRATLDDRQHALRAEVIERFNQIAGDESRRLYRKTFTGH